jgi:OOP family OmpA-OmpF porin
VAGNKVEITEKIQFDDGKSTIKPASDELIAEIADVLKTIPGRKVRVEGHSSSEGDKGSNQKLSEARAKAVVEALVKRGIPKDQLAPKGFGSSQPIGDNATEEGRHKNRRVDFVIIEEPAKKKGRTK